jgi:hypothetical protein
VHQWCLLWSRRSAPRCLCAATSDSRRVVAAIRFAVNGGFVDVLLCTWPARALCVSSPFAVGGDKIEEEEEEEEEEKHSAAAA